MAKMNKVKNLNNTIELGDTVKDPITGFVGVAVARTEFLYSCNLITVQPIAYEENSMSESCYFDEPQLEIICKKTSVNNNVVAIKDLLNK